MSFTDDGIAALLFTADGDMRQAINNLQSTASGFGQVTQETVLKVCDQPHPEVAKQILHLCEQGHIRDAEKVLRIHLWSKGYNTLDIISTLFRVVKFMNVNEYLKVEWIKV